MSDQAPLTGPSLISCAKSNASFGLEVAAQRCGYGSDIDRFRQALSQACADIGIEISGLTDLEETDQKTKEPEGIEISPDTYSQL